MLRDCFGFEAADFETLAANKAMQSRGSPLFANWHHKSKATRNQNRAGSGIAS
jgi:hypothetical protein